MRNMPAKEKNNHKEVECPYCHNKIDHLVLTQTERHFYDFYHTGDYIESDMHDTQEDSREWECPKCHEIIALNQKEAKDFLKKGIFHE